MAYARECLRDSFLRSEAPSRVTCFTPNPACWTTRFRRSARWASTPVSAWGVEAEATVVYVDHGISRGMQYGIERAHRRGARVELRALDPKNNTMKVEP